MVRSQARAAIQARIAAAARACSPRAASARAALAAGLLALAALAPAPRARADDTFLPIAPLDTASADPAFVADMFGYYEIRDETGRKRCRIRLLKAPTIGGMQVEVGKTCAATFPIMGEITAWRLGEGWVIDLVDALRKTRVRFQTPDERYVAIPTIDGIDTIEKLPGR
ncbi:AprI/Inh family metalloprotease inhibitor [Roseixanthobacter liquoris]|uniref:AprI/Inh family metalloprotease inhibitor n=1 Tax=Roseixanthobacter liquoris TaxID=3119921 RepID=UPI00372AF8E1